MEEKNYKNSIESAAMAEDFSIDDILDEFRTGAAPRHFGDENVAERSKRIVLDAFEENAGHSSISSIEELIDESMDGIFPEKEESFVQEQEAYSEEVEYESSVESGDEDLGTEEGSPSEFEIRKLVDSDEREIYASADIDFELGEDFSGDEPPVVHKEKNKAYFSCRVLC